MSFDLDQFVAAARNAAASPQPSRSMIALLKSSLLDPAAIEAAVPNFDGDEKLLYQDDGLAIYLVKFPANLRVPPHDHQIPAFIGVYRGVEVNELFRRSDAGGLEKVTEKHIGVGRNTQHRPRRHSRRLSRRW